MTIPTTEELADYIARYSEGLSESVERHLREVANDGPEAGRSNTIANLNAFVLMVQEGWITAQQAQPMLDALNEQLVGHGYLPTSWEELGLT